ncbi:DUF397 domain-containing protein [Actinokineospora sp. G85]|uniref:DUF397 domain-containing protein n=1 Tax=Actinokineospora sp. G85 TaxID=3406626 RepID=UPI003C736DEA
MEWRKASFSDTDGNCVQVRQDLTAVRDSKNPAGPTLAVDLRQLAAVARSGKLDR